MCIRDSSLTVIINHRYSAWNTISVRRINNAEHTPKKNKKKKKLSSWSYIISNTYHLSRSISCQFLFVCFCFNNYPSMSRYFLSFKISFKSIKRFMYQEILNVNKLRYFIMFFAFSVWYMYVYNLQLQCLSSIHSWNSY